MMRRLVAAAVLTAAVLAGAACTSDNPAPDAGATPAGRGSSAGGDAGGTTPGNGSGGLAGTATGNAEQVCADARALSTEQVTEFVEQLAAMLTAAGDGDTAAADKAERAAEAAVDTWASGLRAQAEKADDTRLAQVLRDMAAETATMTTDIESIDEASIDKLQQRLDELCGQ